MLNVIRTMAILYALALTLVAPALTFAHGGGLDSYGGHHNRKAGGYHVHRGPLAGNQYSSQADMLQDLKKQGQSAPAPGKLATPDLGPKKP